MAVVEVMAGDYIDCGSGDGCTSAIIGLVTGGVGKLASVVKRIPDGVVAWRIARKAQNLAETGYDTRVLGVLDNLSPGTSKNVFTVADKDGIDQVFSNLIDVGAIEYAAPGTYTGRKFLTADGVEIGLRWKSVTSGVTDHMNTIDICSATSQFLVHIGGT